VGFVGGHLVQRLISDGCQSITVLDNLSRGLFENIARDSESIRFFHADIRDEHAVARVMENIDLVFHLAAQSSIIRAQQDIDYLSSTNIVGTATVLRVARAAGVHRVVFTSSREVYGEPTDLPVPETAPLRPKNAYGMSKVSGEMCCALFGGHAMETVILRLANVYGPRDRDRVIPLFVENALKGLPLTVYSGAQILDFVHVDHVVDALMKAGFGEHIDCPVNVGSGEGTTVAELAARILKLTNSNSQISWKLSRDVEVVRFVADTTRAKTRLGLNPPEGGLLRLPELIAWTGKENQRVAKVPRSVTV